MITISDAALRARPFGDIGQIPSLPAKIHAAMTPLHLAAALLMVTIWVVALRARPFGDIGQIPSLPHGSMLR